MHILFSTSIVGCLLATFSFLEAASVINVKNSNIPKQQSNCTSDSSCYPANLTGLTVPKDYISCGVQGICVCSSNCFALNGTICGYSKCGWYDSNSQTCNSLKKSQLTAFLLSLFVSGFGAANFYIGQNGLGGGQLAIFITTLSMGFVICYILCCFFCSLAGSRDDMKGSFVFIGAICCVVLTTVIGGFTMVAWSIADIVIFATNGRLDGNGCALETNL